jgi:sulfur carrier protein
MRVTVNGEERILHDGATVREVVQMVSSTDKGVAVALNETVVSRSQWPDVTLSDGDRIEVLTAAAGG